MDIMVKIDRKHMDKEGKGDKPNPAEERAEKKLKKMKKRK